MSITIVILTFTSNNQPFPTPLDYLIIEWNIIILNLQYISQLKGNQLSMSNQRPIFNPIVVDQSFQTYINPVFEAFCTTSSKARTALKWQKAKTNANCLGMQAQTVQQQILLIDAPFHCLKIGQETTKDFHGHATWPCSFFCCKTAREIWDQTNWPLMYCTGWPHLW